MELTSKQMLREQTLHARRSIVYTKRQQANTVITQQLLQHPELKRSKTIGIYISIAEEVDTHIAIRTLLTLGKTVVVPKISPSDTIRLYRITSLADVQPGAFQILEPTQLLEEIKPEKIDLFIVPGVAFDNNGHRLGWGKGYYDKLLSGVTVPKMGLAFSCQIVPHIPIEPYDILMTTIITEKETIEART